MNKAENMEGDFELYEEGPVGWTRERVHVTLAADGHLFLNKWAVKALFAHFEDSSGSDRTTTPSDDHLVIPERIGMPLLLRQGGEPKGVALLYDKRRQLIGVMAAELGKKHVHPLRTKHGSAGRVVNAKGFCKRYGIKTSETVAFTDAKVNRDGVLVLDLQRVHAVTREN